MPESDISGFSGDVTLPSSHGGEAYAFTMRSTQNKKNTSRYGNSRFVKKRGGMIEITGEVTVFLRKGASGTSPGATTLEADGASLVLQADTGCTWTGSALLDFSINHRIDDPAIEGTYPFEATGDWAEVWATT